MKLASIIMVIAATIGSVFYNLKSSSGYQIGDTATDFSLKNIDGKMVSLSDFKGAKGYVIVFTCNHCPFAKAYEERIEALNKKYAPKGYPLIAINPNDPSVQPEDSYNNMIVRAKDKGFTFPYLLDEGQKIYPQYGATKTPHVFLLNADRKVMYMGAIDDNVYEPESVEVKYLENALEALIAGKPITTTTTKAIGCSIKAK